MFVPHLNDCSNFNGREWVEVKRMVMFSRNIYNVGGSMYILPWNDGYVHLRSICGYITSLALTHCFVVCSEFVNLQIDHNFERYSFRDFFLSV